MKKFSVEVVMSFWQTIEVEAADREDAANIAYDLFDSTKPMTQGEGEVMDVVEIEGEAMLDALIAQYEEDERVKDLENFDPITHIEAQEKTGEIK